MSNTGNEGGVVPALNPHDLLYPDIMGSGPDYAQELRAQLRYFMEDNPEIVPIMDRVALSLVAAAEGQTDIEQTAIELPPIITTRYEDGTYRYPGSSPAEPYFGFQLVLDDRVKAASNGRYFVHTTNSDSYAAPDFADSSTSSDHINGFGLIEVDDGRDPEEYAPSCILIISGDDDVVQIRPRLPDDEIAFKQSKTEETAEQLVAKVQAELKATIMADIGSGLRSSELDETTLRALTIMLGIEALEYLSASSGEEQSLIKESLYKEGDDAEGRPYIERIQVPDANLLTAKILIDQSLSSQK